MENFTTIEKNNSHKEKNIKLKKKETKTLKEQHEALFQPFRPCQRQRRCLR